MISISQPTGRPNFTAVKTRATDGKSLTIFFSYETPIGYIHGGDVVVSENRWSSTTGKHINYVSTGARLPRGEFLEAFEIVCPI